MIPVRIGYPKDKNVFENVNWVFKIRIQFNYVVTLKKRVFLHCYPSTEGV